ncbi:hypothetical protein [Pseudoalteromonas spongiae]|uniref:Uncharacterized protein n=1 Tax=Pseudoalteromonas spongiae TaxID=298657 RepID=A0ABU8EZ95_9GAMM
MLNVRRIILLGVALVSTHTVFNAQAGSFDYDKKNLLVGDTHTLSWHMPEYEKCLNVSGVDLGTSGRWSVKRNSIGRGSSSINCYKAGSHTPKKYTVMYSVFEKQSLIDSLESKFVQSQNPSSWSGFVTSNLTRYDVEISHIGWPEPEPIFTYSFGSQYTNPIGITTVGYDYAMWVDGLISLYQSSNSSNYAEYALDMVYQYLRSGVHLKTELDGSGSYLDWYSPKASRLDHWHYEWRAAYGMAQVASSLRNDPNFYSDPRLSEIKSFLINDFEKKWRSRINNETVTHMLSRAGLVYLYLHDLTGNSFYKSQASNLASKLNNSLRQSEKVIDGIRIQNIRCYLDKKDCASETLLVEGSIDVSHANDTLHFIIESYKRNVVFNDSSIQLLINTLKHSIYDKDKKYFRSNLYTVSGHPNEIYSNLGNLQGVWAKLAEYDRELLFMYLKWLDVEVAYTIDESLPAPINTPLHRTKSGLLSPWTTQIMGNIALAIKDTASD